MPVVHYLSVKTSIRGGITRIFYEWRYFEITYDFHYISSVVELWGIIGFVFCSLALKYSTWLLHAQLAARP
jgi:hypothetical protein